MVDQNINQVELSRICGVSRSTVSKWMSGDSEPTKARRNEIAAILNLQENFFEEIVIPVEKIETLSVKEVAKLMGLSCLLYTSPSPRDTERSRMPSSA